MRKSHNRTAAWMAMAFCSVALPAQAAYAQDTSTGSSRVVESTVEEIIVTAQKRATSLQDTAVAISAFSGETLEERGIDDVSSLQSYVPNLHIGQEQDGFKISLRGIGLQGTSSITDSGVAFYVDNFYIARPAGGSAVFYDTDRIEVLRGPQGTLYGRNATGGVVNVIAKAPSPELGGQIGLSYGSRNLFEARGVLNLPLGEDVAARISAVYTEEDGYIENLSNNPGTDDFLGSNGDLTVRGQLAFGDKEESVEVLLYGSYSSLNGTGVAMTFLERNIGGPPPTRALLLTVPAEPADPLVTNNDQPGYNDTESKFTFVRLTKSFGSTEAVLQAGRMWQTSNVQQDFDGSPVNVSIFNKDQDSTADSVEFRLLSTGEAPLSWIVGGYYFAEDTYIFRRVRLKGLTPGGVISLPDFLLDEWGESSTIAGFGSATYALTPDFRASLGVRYTKDEKSGRKVTRGNFGQPFPPNIPNAAFPGQADFSKTTWRAGVEWDPQEDVLVYATVSNGYKAGGFNLTSNGAPYDPETVMAYEFGIKSDLWERRARINVDAFYYSYQDMQLTTLMTINGAPGQFTTNAAESTIYGLEVDSQFKLGSGFTLLASYAFINAEFEEYFNRDPRNPTAPLNPSDPAGLGRTDLSGMKVPYVAENTLNLGLRYDADLGAAGALTAAFNYNWHDELFLREYNDPVIDRVGAGSKTDITVTWFVADTDLKVTGYVTNLEDEVERNNIYLSPGFIGESATTSFTKPRTVGLRVDLDF